MRGVVDTSVFVAVERGEAVGALPDEGSISVMTIAE
jgi:predicted nucleic acid-binding protein